VPLEVKRSIIESSSPKPQGGIGSREGQEVNRSLLQIIQEGMHGRVGGSERKNLASKFEALPHNSKDRTITQISKARDPRGIVSYLVTCYSPDTFETIKVKTHSLMSLREFKVRIAYHF
jgi:hypothetical protein